MKTIADWRLLGMWGVGGGVSRTGGSYLLMIQNAYIGGCCGLMMDNLAPGPFENYLDPAV